MTDVAGVLLTGGASRRMGADKASLAWGGVSSAVRLGRLLARVASPAVEVGPGRSGLPSVLEEPRGAGPLVALGRGREALRHDGHRGAVLALACDLPFVGEPLLRLLATWPGARSAVPVVAGRPQPLCARWSAEDLDAIATIVALGRRSMQALLERPGVELLGEDAWSAVADARTFADVDTPEDLVRLGLTRHCGDEPPAGGGDPA